MSFLETPDNLENNLEEVEAKNFLEDLFGVKEVEFAPSMEIQAQEIAEVVLEFPELEYENWKELTPEERIDVLQNLETEVARIEHRDALPVKAEDLGDCVYGQYSPQTNDIAINADLLESDSMEDYKQVLNTYFHEGRHAYQFYNLLVERVEPNDMIFESWKVNLEVLGYNSGDYGIFGYEEYYTQPVEVDSRVFAENVMDKLDLR